MPDDVTPDPEATPERPEWLLPKYDSVDAQAQAYAESQAEMNRMRSQMEQERQSFTAALEGMQAPAPPPQYGPQSQGYDPSVTAYAQNLGLEYDQAAAMLAAQAQYTMQPTIEAVGRLMDEKLSAITPAVQEAQAAARQHDIMMAEGIVERLEGPERYAELMPRVKEVIAAEPLRWLPPGSSVEGYTRAIQDVIKLVEHDTLQRTVAELQQERADKLAAQTLSGGYNRPAGDPDADRAEFERIKNTPTGSFAELLANNARRQA